MKSLVIALVVIIMSGCTTTNEFVESRMVATSGQDVPQGIAIDIEPMNTYLKETSLSTDVKAPYQIRKGQFVSSYYKEKFGYPKYVEKLNYFIVVLSVYSIQDSFSMELSSLKINLEDGTSLSPSEWYSGQVIPTTAPTKKAYSIDKNKVRCYYIQSLSLMEDVKNQVIKIAPEETECIILKYPLYPIYPESEFSFSINKVFVNGHDVAPLKFNFKTINFKQTSGYGIGF